MWPTTWLRDWLTQADLPQHADLIFVMAGRRARKIYALELFKQGFAPRLLLSVARFEIRRLGKLDLPVPLDLLAIASPVPPPERHFFASFERGRCDVERIPLGTFGTLSEIQALAIWLAPRANIRSLLIISSGTHLRRVRMCCRFLLPRRLELRFVASPAARMEKETEPSIFGELLKLPLYRIVLLGRRPAARVRSFRISPRP